MNKDCGCKKEDTCNCSKECDCGCQDGKPCTCEGDCKCVDEGCTCGCTDEKEVKHKKNKKKEKNKYKEEIEKLKNDIKKKEEEVLVAKTDLIKYRKRKDEEVTRLLKFCNEDLIKQILPILDNFERAIKLDDDNLEDEVSKFLEGFKMIYCNMQRVMENFEVKVIDGANKPFDPIYHNAIMVEQREGVEPGMVLEVLQKGYIYKDKVIRPAMVKVSE